LQGRLLDFKVQCSTINAQFPTWNLPMLSIESGTLSIQHFLTARLLAHLLSTIHQKALLKGIRRKKNHVFALFLREC